MPLNHFENTVQKHSQVSRWSIPDRTEQPVASKNGMKKLSICRLFCGGLVFTGLTVGIFWYQFSKIPAGSRPPLGEQLQWGYLFWLLLFLPIETCAAGLRIWVISRVLQPGVSLWTCLKAEWANLGLAMLTPSQTGGGIGQVYILCRGGMQFGTALTVSLISFLGSMVILLFVGLHSLLISGPEHLTAFFQGAFLLFFLVFSGLIAAACWPASVRWVVLQISSAVSTVGQRSGSQDSLPCSKDTRLSRAVEYLQTLLNKIIDLCYLHQNNIRLFFRLNHRGFLWVCLLSLVFMLSRSMIAFLCLRFLGIETAGLGHVLETQLSLIFLIYFAPTPGSSGLAEGASMLMMDSNLPAALMPYYNLLWRCTTFYLPAIAGLLLLLWTLMQDARRAGRR